VDDILCSEQNHTTVLSTTDNTSVIKKIKNNTNLKVMVTTEGKRSMMEGKAERDGGKAKHDGGAIT